MKKTKNAFTLIELLAVIVILAVIALIATPIILGIVEDAKRDAFLRSVELVVSSTDLDVMDKLTDSGYQYKLFDGSLIDNIDEKKLIGYEIVDVDKCIEFFLGWDIPEEDAGIMCYDEKHESMGNVSYTEFLMNEPEDATMLLEEGIIKEVYNYTDLGLVKNTEGMNGMIYYNDKGEEEYAIHNGVYCVKKTNTMNRPEISDYVEGECIIVLPTSEKCFAYYHVYEYEITDVNKCIEFYVNEWGNTEEDATSECSNEPQGWYDGLTLTEFLKLNPDEDETLLEANVISKTLINEILITDYYDYEDNDSSNKVCPRDVVIPETIDGKKVVYIGDNAFEADYDSGAYINQITSVKFPNTLESIGYNAFGGNAIEKINMNYNNVEIGDNAFCGHNLSETSIEYQSINTINPNAFACGR